MAASPGLTRRQCLALLAACGTAPFASASPAARGNFHADEGEFIGTDTWKGTPVAVRFRWHVIHGKRPRWDHAFSTDGGRNWEINWRNYFTRTLATATELPRIENDPPEARAWDFLRGNWKVRNRRLRARFANSSDWDEFDSTLRNWQVLIGDDVFNGKPIKVRSLWSRTSTDSPALGTGRIGGRWNDLGDQLGRRLHTGLKIEDCL